MHLQLHGCHCAGTQIVQGISLLKHQEAELFGSRMQVEANDGESARSRLFRVTIKWAADVDVRALIRYVECAPPLTSPVSSLHSMTLHATPSIMARILPAALSMRLMYLPQEFHT